MLCGCRNGCRTDWRKPCHGPRWPRATLLAALLAALALTCCAVPSPAGPGEPQQKVPGPTPEGPTPDAQQTALVAERDRLILSANHAYQTRQYDEAMERLRQLVALYETMYPVSQYPTGHIDFIQVYLSMCNVAEARQDYAQLASLGEMGLRACRTLCPHHDQAETSAAEALLHQYVGKAFHARHDRAKSREHYTHAVDICRACLDQDPNGAMHVLIAEVYDALAQICMSEGDLRTADDYWSRAVSEFEYRVRLAYTLHEQRQYAKYLFARSNALRHLGRYENALTYAQHAYDVSLRLLLITRSDEDYVNTIRILFEQGALHRDVGNNQPALSALENVRCKLLSEDNHDARFPGMLDAVLCNLLVLAVSQEDQRALEICRHTLLSRHAARIGRSPLGGDAVEYAELMRNLAYAFGESDDYALAEHYYGQAVGLLSTDDATVSSRSKLLEMAVVRHDRALLFDRMGRYQEAQDEYVQALGTAHKLYPAELYPSGHPLLSRVMQNMATHCWMVGETDRAADLYHQVVVMNESFFPTADYPDGHPRLQEAYAAWSDVLTRERRFDEAETYAVKSHEMIVKRAGGHAATTARGSGELADSWVRLGRLRRARGDYAAADELFQQVLRIHERAGSGDAGSRLEIALVLAELGRPAAADGNSAAALEYHQRSLAMHRDLFPAEAFPTGHPTLANALRDLGVTYLDAGQPVEAFGLLAESAGMEHAIGEAFFGGGSEAQLLNLAARRFQSLGPLLEAWRQTQLPAEDVYQYVWMRHGFVPRLIADRQRALRALARDSEPASYEKYAAARQDLARALLVSVTDQERNNTPRIERIRELNVTKEHLEQELTRSLESMQAACPPAEQINMLARSLPAKSVFVDFFSSARLPFDATLPNRSEHGTADRFLAFVVSGDRPVACVDVGDSSEIATLVEAGKKEWSTGDIGTAALTLRQRVWDPVCRCFAGDVDTVYIAPDGILAEVAWNALPGPGESGVLLEQFAIATVPHGSFLLDRLREPKSDQRSLTPVLAVGDVDYGHPEQVARVASQGLKQLRWEPLPASRRELEAIVARIAPDQLMLLTGDQATPENVLAGLRTAHAAHFATHGFFVDQDISAALDLAGTENGPTHLTINRTRTSVLGRSPLLRSGLALAGANTPAPNDESGVPISAPGILTAESIATVDGQHLQLVVLSACDTSRGDVALGDGILGIQNAFHIAGARNVVAGLWKVPDEPTAELMSDFYRLLWVEHQTPLAALREAQLNMLHRGRAASARLRSPGPELSKTVRLNNTLGSRAHNCRTQEWAGFVLSGPGF